jgi:endoglucanase
MKKNLNSSLFFQLALCSLLLIFGACSDSASSNIDQVDDSPSILTAKELIIEMGTGLNIGNTFDNGFQSTSVDVNKKLIDLFVSAGLTHVRIPVTWMDGFGGDHLANENGEVNFAHPRFLALKQVIDYAIEKKLYVVLNAHHEHWLYQNYDGSASYDTIFATLWTDIATHFKDYSQYLSFEVLNEPQGVFGQWGGAVQPNSAQGIAYTRKINLVAYEAIRATGGNNAHRIIQVGTNGMGNHNQLAAIYPNKNSLPGGGNDPYLAAHVHTYDPWEFCGQNGRNTNYPGKAAIEQSIRSVAAHAASLDIPLNYGEWGVGRDNNAEERNTDLVREHYRLVRLTMLDVGASPTAWDDRGWFGLTRELGGNFGFVNNIVPYMMAE